MRFHLIVIFKTGYELFIQHLDLIMTAVSVKTLEELK